MQIDLKKFIESMYKYGQHNLSYSNAIPYALAEQGYKIYDEHHVVPIEEIKGNNGGISPNELCGDEKVRKALLEMVHDTTGDSLWVDYNIHKEEAIAYLEKQDEKTSDKIVEKAKTEKQRVLLTETDGSANIDWDCRSLQDVKLLLEYGLDYIKKLEKQGEQKSVELANGEDYGIDGLWTALDILQKTYGKVEGYQTDDGILEHECAIAAVKKLYEQKTAKWSEEDDLTCESIIDTLKRTNGASQTKVDWLKSLKDRVHPLPKKQCEYNPYKAVVESIAKMCKHYDNMDVGSLQDFYDNVKVKCKDAKEYDSLYPQSTWKPSDGQMKLLREVQQALLGKDCHNRFVNFMYELKKLREE